MTEHDNDERGDTMTQLSGIDVLIPPNPDVEPASGDKAPGRPTTRAGRRAAAEARRAAGGTDKPPKAKKSTPAPRKATLETRLTDSFVMIGATVAAVGGMTSPAVQADGVLIVQHAANLGAALDTVAKNDPRVARALERMLTVGTYGALVAAVTPLAIGIAANHRMIPPEFAAQLGVEVPDIPAPQPADYIHRAPEPPAGGVDPGTVPLV